MKSIILTICMLFIAVPALANPFLVCDPQTGVTHYSIIGLGILSSDNIPAQTDGSLKLDLNGLPVGKYSIEVKACIPEVCSAPAFFTFEYGGIPSSPAYLRLIYVP